MSQNPFLLGALACLLVNCMPYFPNYNDKSRLATMAAIAEEGVLYVDSVRPWTEDLSFPPDGHVYSNKAPGPALLGMPIYYPADLLLTFRIPTQAARYKQRDDYDLFLSWGVSVAMQLLPYLGLAWWCGRELQRAGVSSAGQWFAALGLFFGTTISQYLNSYFGHGLGAVAVLATMVALLRERWVVCGAAFGVAVLSDYGCALLFPGLLAAVWAATDSPVRALVRIGIGGLLPFLIFCWYHTVCFGGPLTLPNKYQNPLFVDIGDDPHAVWGVIRLFPRLEWLGELLFGAKKGILYTQPWFFVVFGTAIVALRPQTERVGREERLWTIFAVPGFLGMLWMNASFGGWHGGSTTGPRYLSPILPVFAILAGYQYARWGLGLRILAWVGMVYAVLLCAVNAAMAARTSEHDTIWAGLHEHYNRRLGFLPMRCAWLGFIILLTLVLSRRRRSTIAPPVPEHGEPVAHPSDSRAAPPL